MTISLKTPIPGPKSQALLARRKAAVPQGPTNITPIFAASASGATVTDVDGNVFLDFAGGIGTLNVGHAPRAVVDAVKAQAEKFLHTCFHVAMYEPYVALAEKLNAITPGTHAKKTLLVNSGAEAVENAVKIARYFTKRPAVVGFEHGFAGRTLMGMSLTSKPMPYKSGFGPLAPEVYRMPYPYAYRDALEGEGDDAYEERAIRRMRDFFNTHVDPKQTACVLLEPVTGEGGFIVAPPRFVRALAAFCKEHGIVFVADEIQTGFCRTGKWFAIEHSGVEPDLVIMAKSLGAGLPISAVTGRAEIMDSVHVGGLGGTYGGNPVACAAALAAIGEMESRDLGTRATAIGTLLRQRLDGWQRNIPRIGNVRGLGAMCAMELVKDRASREPDKDFTAALVKRCWENGLLVLSAGNQGNVLRFLVPLVISDEQLDEGLDVIETLLTTNEH